MADSVEKTNYDPLAPCDRCNHVESILYSLSLIDVDPVSMDEGKHIADVDFRLCIECEQEVADLLLRIRDIVLRKSVNA